MKGSLCYEFETGLPAAEVWEVYGTLQVGQLVPELLPDVIEKVELVEGDGGVGTVLRLTFPPGIPGLRTYKEQFIKIDNENYIKEATVIEGDLLELGFRSYLVRFEICKQQDSSIIRSTIEYEIGEEHASNASFVSTAAVAAISEAITKYLKERKSSQHALEQNSQERSSQEQLNIQDE